MKSLVSFILATSLESVMIYPSWWCIWTCKNDLNVYIICLCTCVWLQLGGKGGSLAEMASIGLSVPPGITISTEACQEYQMNGRELAEGLWEKVLEGLETMEKDIKASLGDPSKPLLISVRSGAEVSFC